MECNYILCGSLFDLHINDLFRSNRVVRSVHSKVPKTFTGFLVTTFKKKIVKVGGTTCTVAQKWKDNCNSKWILCDSCYTVCLKRLKSMFLEDFSSPLGQIFLILFFSYMNQTANFTTYFIFWSTGLCGIIPPIRKNSCSTPPEAAVFHTSPAEI